MTGPSVAWLLGSAVFALVGCGCTLVAVGQWMIRSREREERLMVARAKAARWAQ